MKFNLILIILTISLSVMGQADRWQQRVAYDMEIDFDVKTHQFKGQQEIKYYNNSPDTLDRVFYHLYFNAFQPESMMDVRSRTIADADKRVGGRISTLKEDEMGYHKVISLKQNGQLVKTQTEGTILEVTLAQPLLPGKKAKLEMEFEAQVPVQIRRSGRDNAEGISYSMSQWYPKLCEYDYQGWHANPYIGREFYGVWGDFDVKIKIDRKYAVAASGVLQNVDKMGHGYSDKNTKKRGLFGKKKLEWNFKAENVHDFAWGADPDYKHIIATTDAGTELHYLYQENERTQDNWENLHKAMNEAEKYMNKRFGKYPYPVYSFVQGGDGGMEYPMLTLITGERSYSSLVGVSVHEWMHSWYQMLLGTNESLYAWMDEGFTTYGSAEVMNHLKRKGLIPGEPVDNPHYNNVRGYARFTKSGMEEPLSTHADFFNTNAAYGVGSYTKGCVFLKELEYIVGTEDFSKSILRYFDEWKFKHPNPNDFIRVVEKTSDLELDWFKELWVNSTATIDYAFNSVEEENGKLAIKLQKLGKIPMPIDLTIVLKDGTEEKFYIPTRIMRGEKNDDLFSGATLMPDWPWTHSHYTLHPKAKLAEISNIYIDKSERLADVNIEDNVWPIIEVEKEK